MKRLSGSVLRLLLVGVLGWIALPLMFLQPEPTSASPAASKAEPSPFAVETIAVLPETGVASPLPLPNATEDARLWRYSFREPRVIFTHDSIIGVAGWLPDSRNLTLILNDTTSLGFEQIRTIDVVTGRTQSFGNRLNLFREDHPAWLADVGKMAFRGTDKLVEGGVAPPYHLWLAEAGTTKLITPTLRGITASSGGDHWVIATRRNQSRPVLVNAATGQKQIVQVDLQEYGIDVNNIYVQMAWHPSLPKVAVFDPNGFVVINLKDNHVSVIDLGKDADEYHGYDKRWAFDARWSPDGQRMALITTARLPILTYSELTVLDMTTGKHTNFVFDHQYKYVTSLTWAPDSETLLASVVIDNNGGYDRLGLILVDAATGVSRRILPDSTFYGGQFSFGVEWSPDGKTVAVYCPTENEGRVCTIEVSTVPTQIRLEGIQEMGSGVTRLESSPQPLSMQRRNPSLADVTSMGNIGKERHDF